MDYRTDLAMERTVRPGGMGEGVSVHTQQQAGAEVPPRLPIPKEERI